MRQRYNAHHDRISFNTVDDSDIRVKFSPDPPVRVARRSRRLPVSESVAVGALRHLYSRHLDRRPVITVDDHGGHPQNMSYDLHE